jgi:hypothetical protein
VRWTGRFCCCPFLQLGFCGRGVVTLFLLLGALLLAVGGWAPRLRDSGVGFVPGGWRRFSLDVVGRSPCDDEWWGNVEVAVSCPCLRCY